MSIGLVVNPIAGMGGRVGLKGTDGVVQEAVRLGARPVSPRRAIEFLAALKSGLETSGNLPRIITCRQAMGAEEAEAASIPVSEILPIPDNNNSRRRDKIYEDLQSPSISRTEPSDTKAAVKEFLHRNVNLIVFVGGDGTARDIVDALNEWSPEKSIKERKIKERSLPPVLGVPSGVKMYSGVFALNPVSAAQIVTLYVERKAAITDLEVMDIDEEAFRSDHLSIRLYGYLKGLYVPMMSQASKELSSDMVDEKENQRATAKTIVESIDPEGLYVLGPGTTIRCIADMLGVEKTLLGVDLYYKGKVIAPDANEDTILKEMQKLGAKRKTWIILSPIGRQGMILGRGNQQISPQVIREVGKDHIIVVATKSKVRDLDGGTLKVDTGDRVVDRALKGYVKVLTDYKEWRMIEVR